MADKHEKYEYSAKKAYDHAEAPADYEKRSYYQGLLGAYRKRREGRAVRAAVSQFEPRGTALDCPCGNGRWFSALSEKCSIIVARDSALAMVAAARQRSLPGVRLHVGVGDAENLDLDDNEVDNVFSYALMKHLPLPVQFRVLREFARVSRSIVAVSYAILGVSSFPLWRFRNDSESYPVWRHELEWMAREAGLRVNRLQKIGTPIGLETMVIFGRNTSS